MTVLSVLKDGYRGAFPVVLLSAFGGLLAGTILGGMEAELKSVRGLLVMVPAFLAIRGSVYGSLGARLSSALHQGLLTPRFDSDNRLLSAVAAALLNGVTANLAAAILTYGILTVSGRAVAPLWVLVFIAALGGILAGLVLTVTIVSIVFIGYRRGMDPDNLVGPTMTTAGDIFGMVALLLATRLAISLL